MHLNYQHYLKNNNATAFEVRITMVTDIVNAGFY